MSAPEKLSPGMPLAIETGPTALSVVSYWEVMLKQTALSDFAATLLPLRSDHIAEVYNLPPIHQTRSTGTHRASHGRRPRAGEHGRS